jgi:hypothetical protein
MDKLNLKNISYGEILKEYNDYEETSEFTDSIFTDSVLSGTSSDLTGGKGKKGKKSKKMKKKKSKKQKKPKNEDDDSETSSGDDSDSGASTSSRRSRLSLRQLAQDSEQVPPSEENSDEIPPSEDNQEVPPSADEKKYNSFWSFIGLTESDTESSGGAPKKKKSKKTSPKKKSPKKKSPKKGSPKKGSPKKGSPKKGSPKKVSPKKDSPKKKSPKKVSPKKDSPKKVSPKKVSPKKVSPKKKSPKKPKKKSPENVLSLVTSETDETGIREESQNTGDFGQLLKKSLPLVKQEVIKKVSQKLPTVLTDTPLSEVVKPTNFTALTESESSNRDIDELINKLTNRIASQVREQVKESILDEKERLSELTGGSEIDETSEAIPNQLMNSSEISGTSVSEDRLLPIASKDRLLPIASNDNTSSENPNIKTEDLSTTSEEKSSEEESENENENENSLGLTESELDEQVNNNISKNKDSKYESTNDFYTTTIFNDTPQTQGVLNDLQRGANKLYNYLSKMF